jgi:hypothetical protein
MEHVLSRGWHSCFTFRTSPEPSLSPEPGYPGWKFGRGVFSVYPRRCRSKWPKMLSYRFPLHSFLFPCFLTARLGPRPPNCWGFEVTHTYTHHTRYDSSGRRIGPSQRPLPIRNLVDRNYAVPLLKENIYLPVDFLWYITQDKLPHFSFATENNKLYTLKPTYSTCDLSSVTLTSPPFVERALMLDATWDTMARVGEMFSLRCDSTHGFYSYLECWRRHDNDVLTMGQRDTTTTTTTTTQHAVSSVAQSQTHRHRRCDFMRFQNALLVDSITSEERNIRFVYVISRTLRFVWLERSWLFEKGEI